MKTKNVEVQTPVVEEVSNVELIPHKEEFDLNQLKSVDINTLNLIIQECLKLKKEKSPIKQAQNIGVGNFVKELIFQGLGNKEILAKVHEHYGNQNTTYACVAWYRNDMKNKGLI